MLNDLIDDHANKDRPVLSPSLFVKPDEEMEKEEDKRSDQNNDEVEEEDMEIEQTNKEGHLVAVRNDSFNTDVGITSNGKNSQQHHNGGGEKLKGNEMEVNPYDEFFSLSEDKKVNTKPTATVLSPLHRHQSSTTPSATKIVTTKKPATNTRVASVKRHSDKGKSRSRWKGLFKHFNAKKTKQQPRKTTATVSRDTRNKENRLG